MAAHWPRAHPPGAARRNHRWLPGAAPECALLGSDQKTTYRRNCRAGDTRKVAPGEFESDNIHGKRNGRDKSRPYNARRTGYRGAIPTFTRTAQKDRGRTGHAALYCFLGCEPAGNVPTAPANTRAVRADFRRWKPQDGGIL